MQIYLTEVYTGGCQVLLGLSHPLRKKNYYFPGEFSFQWVMSIPFGQIPVYTFDIQKREKTTKYFIRFSLTLQSQAPYWVNKIMTKRVFVKKKCQDFGTKTK